MVKCHRLWSNVSFTDMANRMISGNDGLTINRLDRRRTHHTGTPLRHSGRHFFWVSFLPFSRSCSRLFSVIRMPLPMTCLLFASDIRIFFIGQLLFIQKSSSLLWSQVRIHISFMFPMFLWILMVGIILSLDNSMMMFRTSVGAIRAYSCWRTRGGVTTLLVTAGFTLRVSTISTVFSLD